MRLEIDALILITATTAEWSFLLAFSLHGFRF